MRAMKTVSRTPFPAPASDTPLPVAGLLAVVRVLTRAQPTEMTLKDMDALEQLYEEQMRLSDDESEYVHIHPFSARITPSPRHHYQLARQVPSATNHPPPQFATQCHRNQ